MAGVEGRAVVITGAAGSLGREYALLFAERGAKVVVNDRGTAADGTGSDSRPAYRLTMDILAAGGEAVASYDDVSADGDAVIRTAVEAFGRVDVVVCAAAIARDASFHRLAERDWRAVVDVGLHGVHGVVRSAWPYLREQAFGRVVVTTSAAGLYGSPGRSACGAAALGAVGLVNTLALEGRAHNITANAVAPVAATRRDRGAVPPELVDTLAPAYAAPLVAYLGSEECDESGSVILAGAGHYARVALLQAKGVRFGRVPTVEALSASWDAVTDLRGARFGGSPSD